MNAFLQTSSLSRRGENLPRRMGYKKTLSAAFLLTLVATLYVWQHFQVVRLSYDVAELRRTRDRLRNEYYYRWYQLNEMKSLNHVERMARETLKMTTPRSDQVVVLEEKPEKFSWTHGEWEGWDKP